MNSRQSAVEVTKSRTRHDDYPLSLRATTGRNRLLRRHLLRRELVLAPGAYDGITARLVEKAGFQAVYLTGSGMSMSSLGAPDVGLMSFAEVLDRTSRITDVVSIPVIVDADTGYGGVLNVVRTVREFERAGVSAIQLEDQDWPKKCGHESGRKLVSMATMGSRLKAAVDARVDPDLILVARTDARSDLGLQAAIERAQFYAECGADVVFIESPESRAELQTIARDLSSPLLINMVEGGRTPVLPVSELKELGFSIVIYPNTLTRLFCRQGLELLDTLRREGTTLGVAEKMLNHRELWSLFEYEKWLATEARLECGQNDVRSDS